MNTSNTNAGGWEQSEIRAWLTSNGMNMLPDDLRERIKSVKKKTNNIGKIDSPTSISTTTDRLWLFSTVELFGTTDFFTGSNAYCNTVLNAEGEKYKLFRDCGTAMGQANEILAKRMNNNDCAWLTRSPLPASDDVFCGVNKFGENASASASGHKYTVCPGFSL